MGPMRAFHLQSSLWLSRPRIHLTSPASNPPPIHPTPTSAQKKKSKSRTSTPTRSHKRKLLRA